MLDSIPGRTRWVHFLNEKRYISRLASANRSGLSVFASPKALDTSLLQFIINVFFRFNRRTTRRNKTNREAAAGNTPFAHARVEIAPD